MLTWFVRIVLTLVVLAAGAALAGWVLLAEPDIPRATLEAKYATAPSQLLKLDSGDVVHFRDQGPRDQEPLVLLNGSNASLHTWEPWVALMPDVRIITLDLQAHGLTGPIGSADYSQKAMAGLTIATLDKLGVGRFALGGNSMGGGVAARVALEHPGRVSHLILVAAAGIDMPAGQTRAVPLAFQLLRTPVVRDVLRDVSPRFMFERSLRSAVSNETIITEGMIDRYWELARLPGQRAATVARVNQPGDRTLEESAGRIATPALILWGREDSWVPLGIGERWDARLPQSTLIVYDGIGHLPHEEAAERSAADVRAFLGR